MGKHQEPEKKTKLFWETSREEETHSWTVTSRGQAVTRKGVGGGWKGSRDGEERKVGREGRTCGDTVF